MENLVLLRSRKSQASAGRDGKATEGRLMSCQPGELSQDPMKALLTAMCGIQGQKQTTVNITCGRP